MSVIRVNPAHPSPAVLARAAEILRRGGLVAFPTETVYGLGANALDEEAVRRIFAAKGRPAYNPLIAHIADVDAARRLVTAWPDAAERLAKAFWPGPLTVVLPKCPEIPGAVTAGLPTLALRVPAHPVAHALLRSVPFPLAAPSANRFTEVSPTTAQHVDKGLGDRVDLILDGGPTPVGIESTVIDLSGDHPVLLRPGSVLIAALRSVVGDLELPVPAADPDAPRPSPGMLDRHYAPRAELRLFGPGDRIVAAEAAERAARLGNTVGALLLTELNASIRHPVHMPGNADAYAQRLYAELHALDELGCDLILAERVPDTPGWAGVRDRIERAAR